MDGQKAFQGLACLTKTGLYKDLLVFGNALGALASLIKVHRPPQQVAPTIISLD
jgi:hypothetical protein